MVSRVICSCLLSPQNIANVATDTIRLWLTVPTVALVSFTLYGIEGYVKFASSQLNAVTNDSYSIGQEIENPFGFDRNDIKMDNICRDVRQEITAALELWKRGKDDHFM